MEDNIKELIKDIFDWESINIKNAINDINKERAIKMINEAYSLIEKFKNNENVSENIINAGISVSNATKFDSADAENVGINNINKFIKALNIIKDYLDYTINKELKRLNNMIHDLNDLSASSHFSNNITSDLNSLTKEELIAIIRENKKQ